MSKPDSQLRIALVDDEAPARNRLRELLTDCSEAVPLTVVGEAASGRDAMELVQREPTDLVLLDIRMPDMDGLETARHLNRLAVPPYIVFTTAYDRYAVSAFELHAVDYLLKPIRATRLQESLLRVRSLPPLRPETLEALSKAPRTHLSVTERGRILLIPVPEVLYLRSELKYVTIRTAEREYLIEESLTRLEEEFAATFVRIHRNCLVAKAHLSGFERIGDDGESHWVALLKGLDERLAVSRRQAHLVRDFGRGA